MNYASMIVCLDNRAASDQRLDFAIQLANQHQAHLTGLHLSYGPLASLIAFDAYGQMSDIALEWELTVEKNQQSSKTDFMNKAKQAGLNCDWDCYRSTELKKVLARARVADIAIIGQVPANIVDNDIGSGFYTQFIINLGKPVLLLPNKAKISTHFKTIIVAWDGGRESTRAIADALPFLRAANLVYVMTAATKKDPDKKLPDVDIAAFLSRHGVKVEIEKVDNITIEAVEWILSRASEVKADLLVMGAYGHNRFNEFILGGMTRTVMQTMPLPVLMSH